MKKVAFADIKKFGTPPKHFNVVSGKFQGEAETGLKSFWMGMSHYLPGGGVEFSGADSAEEKVYFILEGELTVKTETEEFVLGHWDSLYIGPDESRSIVNNTSKPATMIIVVNTLNTRSRRCAGPAIDRRHDVGDVVRLTNLTTGGPVHVDVRDGKILRIVPLELDDSDGPSWTIHARGRDFTPPRRTTLAPYIVANRSHVYSPKRILTPLKRVDFDVTGLRARPGPAAATSRTAAPRATNPSVGTRPSTPWPARSVRNHRELGPAAMLTSPGSHHLWGILGYRTSAYYRFMNLVGFTYGEHNPDSWEGWHWVGMHMWGFSHRLGIPEQYDLLEDALENTEMIVFWSSDPESTGGGIYTAFESTPRRYWFKELGVKMVFIDPYFNHTAGLFADKWIAPRLGHRRGLRSRHRLHLAHRGHLRQGVRRVAHAGLRRVEGLRARRERRRAQDPGVGRGRMRRPRPRDPGPGPGVGQEEDHAGRRRQGRLRRRLPFGHRRRVGPHHDRPLRRCRAWASPASTSGRPRRARPATPPSGSRATTRAASPATRPPRAASVCRSACGPTAATPPATRSTPPRARRSRAC